MTPPPPDHDSDQQLVRQAIAGDARAWEQLVEAHRLLVYRLAYRVTNNAEDAMDATQESFIRILRHLPQWRSGCLRSWITSIVIREAISLLRRRRRHEVYLDPVDLASALDESIADHPQHTIRDVLDTRRQLDRIQLAMETLSPQQRAILLLATQCDLGPAEVAAELNCPANQVRSQWTRAVKTLRRLLNPDPEAALSTPAVTGDENYETR